LRNFRLSFADGGEGVEEAPLRQLEASLEPLIGRPGHSLARGVCHRQPRNRHRKRQQEGSPECSDCGMCLKISLISPQQDWVEVSELFPVQFVGSACSVELRVLGQRRKVNVLGIPSKMFLRPADRPSAIQCSDLKYRKSPLPTAGLFSSGPIPFSWSLSHRRRKRTMTDSGFFPKVFQLRTVSSRSK
jgi:hypothetical protein